MSTKASVWVQDGDKLVGLCEAESMAAAFMLFDPFQTFGRPGPLTRFMGTYGIDTRHYYARVYGYLEVAS